MRAPAVIAACALALACPPAARAEPAAPTSEPSSAAAPSGFVLSTSLGGGAELGLSAGRAGLLDLEVAAGWELGSPAVRPELALALGFAPDSNLAIRPGVRVELPGLPVWIRAAVDWSSARSNDLRPRWFLGGAAWELRVTGALGLFVEADTGVPLSAGAGMPLMVRAGATFRH